MPATGGRRAGVKCLVWDLDDTLWSGILAEGDAVAPAPGVREIVEALDARGILQSVASRNDATQALARLRELGLEEYFLHPEIHWGAKSGSMARIAERLNIGLDAIAFVDDQPFELDEVGQQHPQVLRLPAAALPGLLAMPEFNPRYVTDESRQRRALYRAETQRQEAQDSHAGPAEEFLASLSLRLVIARAGEADLQRLEELTARTNQLNTTGRIYSSAQLDAFRRSDDHALLVARLDDRYGSYGTVGLALVALGQESWRLRLLLMSCRVLSRGVGSLLLHHVMRGARDAGVPLVAEMVPNERNRLMYTTYRFAGFEEIGEDGGTRLLRHDLASIPDVPVHVHIDAEPWRTGLAAGLAAGQVAGQVSANPPLEPGEKPT